MATRATPLLMLITLLVVPRVAAAASIPTILFDTSTVFDTACSSFSKKTIKPEWVTELEARKKKLLAPWRRDGRRLLQTTVALAGHRFRRREISATLSLCGMPTISQPLLLKMHPYLRSFSKSPRALDLLVGTVHHELLHIYLKGRIPPESALLRKYRSRPQRVRAHLHLLSLQRAAYLKLGWKKKLQQIVGNPLNRDIEEAWRIVKREGHQVFLKELRR